MFVLFHSAAQTAPQIGMTQLHKSHHLCTNVSGTTELLEKPELLHIGLYVFDHFLQFSEHTHFLTSLQPVSILNFLIATVSLHLCSLGTELLHRPESSQTLLFLSSGQKNLSKSDLKLLFPINRLISFNLTFLSLQKNIIIFWVCVYFICLGFFCKPTGIFSSAPYFLLIYSLFSEDFHVFVFYPCIPYDCSWGSELVRRLAYCCCLFVFFHIHSASWYM